MKTEQIYLTDSYLKDMEAKMLAVEPEANGFRLMLDKTVFYPMGGGQPTDQGYLEFDGWEAEVYQVMMKDGEIWHYVKADNMPEVGAMLRGEINWERRYKNMKVHSAGHIVDFAMYLLKYSPSPLMPTKGDHGKKPYILYTGNLTTDAESLRSQLESKANELVSQNLKFSTEIKPLEELQSIAIYLQPGLPQNKPLRALTLEGVGAVADGGTQVKNTGEVGEIKISEVKSENGAVIINYQVS